MSSKSDMEPTEHPFPENPASTDYCIFPPGLDDDELVLFHATPSENLGSILKNGFEIPDPTGDSGLQSVSFAKRSIGALNHAMNLREKRPGTYCILAVRYETLNRTGLKNNLDDIHDYTLNPPPKILCFCKIPSSYRHV
jgi:hypothetical protein